MKFSLLLLFLFGISCSLDAQNSARITGNLQTNGNFFIEDSLIGATNTPQYDNQKYGSESWLTLNYSNWGFDMGLRFDVFHQSNLLNPIGSYSEQGIGRWFVSKKIHDLEISGGYLYDQIGSGIIFRAYEERALFIDQALYGVKLGYQINDNWSAKVFSGRTKQQFSKYGSVVRGAAVEGFIKPDSVRNFSLAPGAGVVGRTFDKPTIDQIVGEIATLAPQDREGLQYNSYAMTLYNTATAGPFSWYVEGALKTKDVIYDIEQPVHALPPIRPDSIVRYGRFINRDGYVAYSSLSYAGLKGLGISLEGKLTRNFSFRANPYERAVQGPMNFLPVMSKQNTYRLTTRFVPATRENNEKAVQLDVRYPINKRWSVGLNVSQISTFSGKFKDFSKDSLLNREIYPEVTYKYKKKWQVIAGVQFLRYNMLAYQNKEGLVKATTPALEVLYKFTSKRTLRVEAQYLSTKQEFGSWANISAEFGMAPHWIFFVSNMYKMPHSNHEKTELRAKFEAEADENNLTGDAKTAFVEGRLNEKIRYDRQHFFSAGVVYSRKSNRYSLAYVKQVEGINCAGGICRYEPTFHGVRLNVSASF